MEFCNFGEEIPTDKNINEDDNGYELNVIFNGTNPLIYRIIQVPKDITFRKLHEVIQVVCGFENYHMYQFIDIDENLYIIDENDESIEDKTMIAQKTRINKHFTKNPYILYEYDFGDEWYMTIELSKTVPDTSKAQIMSYEGEYNPAEDIGGPFEFMELLELKQDGYDEDDLDEEELEVLEEIKKIDIKKIQKKLDKIKL